MLTSSTGNWNVKSRNYRQVLCPIRNCSRTYIVPIVHDCRVKNRRCPLSRRSPTTHQCCILSMCVWSPGARDLKRKRVLFYFVLLGNKFQDTSKAKLVFCVWRHPAFPFFGDFFAFLCRPRFLARIYTFTRNPIIKYIYKYSRAIQFSHNISRHRFSGPKCQSFDLRFPTDHRFSDKRRLFDRLASRHERA